MTHNPTPEQQAILDFVTARPENLIIEALAGAAKTSTLVMISHAVREPLLAIAFNKRIAVELADRLAPHATSKTLNALGHSQLRSIIGRSPKIDANKRRFILRELIDAQDPADREALYENFSDIHRAVAFGVSCGYVPTGTHPAAKRLMDDDEFFAHSDTEFTPLERAIIRNASLIAIDRAFEGQCDFDDQILIPTLWPCVFPKFSLVMIDEAQDLSALQHRMLRKIARKRLIAVGDKCHPEGTTVKVVRKLADSWNPAVYEDVPIEHLQVGDKLVGYSTEYSEFLYNRTVEGITCRPYEGQLITIDTGKEACDYTPNHICYADFSRLRNYTALYLMRKGAQWRCGIAAMEYGSASGPIKRARDESADALWILDVFRSRTDALQAEAIIHQAYGIPDVAFSASIQSSGYHNNDGLARLWDKISSRAGLADAACELLTAFGRELSYPIWTPEETYSTFKRPRTIHACNLLNGGLVLPYRGKKREQKSDWLPYKIYRREYSGNVYSLSVSHNHLYVADGIVTHNCQAIYGFRGAHEDSMSKLREEFSMEQLILSVSFRLPVNVAEHVRWRAPHIQSPEWAIPGEVRGLDTWNAATVPDGAAVICRNNAPLFSTALRFLRAGRKPQLLGNDVVKGLIQTMKKLSKDMTLPSEAALPLVNQWATQQRKRQKNKSSVDDKAECIRLFLEEEATLGLAIARAEHVANLTGNIVLTTGHKSKGLEWDDVFFLDEHLIDPERDPQADNLRYVISTRAKRRLTYITSEGYTA